MWENRKFDDEDLQEMWDDVPKWQEIVSDHVKEAQLLELTNCQLELQVKCLEDELSRYKTLVDVHEKSQENWIKMIGHSNEMEGQFSNMSREKINLEKALENEKKVRAENEAKYDERRKNIENELRREIKLTKDSADKMIAEKEEQFKAQLEKYKTEIAECQRDMENRISQYEEKLLKMNSELANAQVEIWTLKQKCSSHGPSALESAESLPIEKIDSDKVKISTVKNVSSFSFSSSQNRAAQYFSQMSAQKELFASRFPSTSVKTMTVDDVLTDDDALTECEAGKPGPVFKKKMSIRSFPAVKKKKLLSSRMDYL